MVEFENGIHEVQVDLLNARRSESEFYLKKYPILLGKFDTRIIVASQNLKGLTSLVKGEEDLSIITELGDAFEVYRERFIKAAEAQVDIGLDENTGMTVDLLAAADELEDKIAKLDYPELDRSLLKIRQYETLVYQWSAVQRPINSHRGAEFARTIRQIEGVGNRTVLTQDRVADHRFDGAHQNCFRRSGRTANRIETIMVAVNEIHVRMSGRTVHRAVAQRFAFEGVTGRISCQIRFRLHNGPAARPVRRVAEEEMPQQMRRYNLCRRRVKAGG